MKDDFSSSSNSCYQSADDYSTSPNIKIGCKDSCCNIIKFVKTLTKSEGNKTDKKQKSTINFEETLKRLNKKKSKDLTVNDLQYEITIIKNEIIKLKNDLKNVKNDNFDLKQEMLLLKIDKQLDNEQFDSESDEQKD